jgi:hypothetical protein
VWLQPGVQVVDNKPLNKASVSTIRGSTSGQQTLNKTSLTTTSGLTSGQQTP